MLKGQIKVVAQAKRDTRDGQKVSRQLPSFIVNAFGFATAKSIVKTMFKNEDIEGQLLDSDGNIEDFSVRS